MDVSGPFPQVDLLGFSTITVDVGGNGAVINSLAVHVYQDAGAPVPETLPPLLAFDPTNAKLEGDLPG